jgi:hypothetical protein
MSSPSAAKREPRADRILRAVAVSGSIGDGDDFGAEMDLYAAGGRRLTCEGSAYGGLGRRFGVGC